MSDVVAIIPARYASTRLPGKPLASIAGQPMIRHVYERPEFKKEILARIPLGRIADPSDVVAPVLFFAAPASGFVTPGGALIIGLVAGGLCYTATLLRARSRVDDALDVFAVHGVPQVRERLDDAHARVEQL